MMQTNNEAMPEKNAGALSRRVIALIVASAILFVAAAAMLALIIIDTIPEKGEKTAVEDELAETFDFSTVKIRDYSPAFASNLYKGLTVAGKGYGVNEITDEDIEDYINSTVLLSYKKATDDGKVDMLSEIDYADAVALYILYAEDSDGARIEHPYFENAYSAATITVGSQVFGKGFDEALIGQRPIDSSFICHTNQKPTAGDVILLTYTATEDGKEKSSVTASQERVDLSVSPLADGILTNCVLPGQQFTFDATADPDDDGDTELWHYTATVNGVVEEHPVKITFTLPDNYFVGAAQTALYPLNGKEVSLYAVLYANVKYDAETYDTVTAEYLRGISSDLGISIGAKATDEEARKALRDAVTDTMTANRKDTQVSLIWEELIESVPFASLPETALNEAKLSLEAQYISAYSSYAQSDASFAAMYPTADDAAPSYFGYADGEYEGYKDYIEKVAAPQAVKQKLLLYGIYGEEKLFDEKAFDEYYKSTVTDYISQGYGDSEAKLDEICRTNYGYDFRKYVEDNLYMTEKVNDFLVENNTVDFDLLPETK